MPLKRCNVIWPTERILGVDLPKYQSNLKEAYLRVERLASPDAVGAAPIVWSRFTNYLIWGTR